jgi:hypothetical protein
VFDDITAMLSSGRSFDLLVVDVGAGEDEAGFSHLEQLRAVGYAGAKVLYTARLTPTRRRAAEERGAQITDNLRDLAAMALDARAAGDTPERRARAPWRGRIRIFIDYRRQDSAGYAGRLFDHLRSHFGDGSVSMDVDAITPGADFLDSIQQAVSSADALVEIIGPNWLAGSDAEGGRRVDDPNDWVRISLGMALASEVPVIPVLVGGARMPSAEELPPELAPLARRNALELTDSRWDYDVERLTEALEQFGTPIPIAATKRGPAYS